MVWGDETLFLSVSRAGFWDRRGGTPFTLNATFERVRERLEANDEAGLRALFAPVHADAPTRPKTPFQLGGARLELRFDGEFSPRRAQLFLERGELEVELHNPSGETRIVKIWVHPDTELCVLEGAQDARVTVRPTWEWVGEELAPLGYSPPEFIGIEEGGGFIQDVPENEALALVWRLRGEQLLIATALNGDIEKAAKEAVTRARALPDTRPEFFWRGYWRDVPQIELPSEELNRKWLLGLWKQAGLTPPQGVAATLQGAWMEEEKLPPWSNDYHFNINVQLIYYPALYTNRLSHFEPLWAMIREWMPTLKASGETFFGRKGALMLPHSVDDSCQVVGTFWTGTIDHACTAWIAQMAWLHYAYGGDVSVLREVAWPLLNGAFEGFDAMSEERDGRLSLPVSVSPEYRGDGMNAWGRDASFQLAAWYMTAQLLQKAALVLGEPVDPRWEQLAERLPLWSLVGTQGQERIALWEGLELEESHRHHSHLAAIWPFMSVDPLEHTGVVARSIQHWNAQGVGRWTGWCLPWASILCSRFDLPDAAVAWLEWLDHYTNVGGGTRHNADFAGISAWDNGEMWSDPLSGLRRNYADEAEVMQMDASLGFLIAVSELLVQSRRNAIHVLPRLPRRWKRLRFDSIRTEGAFLVGATVEEGKTTEVRVRSERGGVLKLAHGLGETFVFNGQSEDGRIFERQMQVGESLVLRRA